MGVKLFAVVIIILTYTILSHIPALNTSACGGGGGGGGGGFGFNNRYLLSHSSGGQKSEI